MKRLVLSGVWFVIIGSLGIASSVGAQGAIESEPESAEKACLEQFKDIEKLPSAAFSALCAQFELKAACKSSSGVAIPHYTKKGVAAEGKRILVVGQIHGDERDAGVLAFNWLERIHRLTPQNTWRIVPRLNPDGYTKNTRTNAHGVDLNRNFPTKEWDKQALLHWAQREKKNPRRYPGDSAGNEPETQCLMSQIEEFKPDLVISVHTPYAVLDYDGDLSNKKKPPKFGGLPWKSLGTYEGSLGRYLWVERQVPVLTVELKHKTGISEIKAFDELQDFASFLSK